MFFSAASSWSVVAGAGAGTGTGAGAGADEVALTEASGAETDLRGIVLVCVCIHNIVR